MFFMFSTHHSTFPHPKIEHLVIPVRTLHPVQGIRKREPVGRKTKSANKSFIKTYRNQFKFVEARLIRSLHYLWAYQICKAPFALLS